MITHFLDLGGLGVRDLTAHDHDILILAGPVSGVRSPFRIYRWRPADRKRQVQTPDLLYPQPDEVHVSKPIIADMARADSDEHPEGICVLARGTKGLIVLYDNPREDPPNSRIDGSKYFADWIPVT